MSQANVDALRAGYEAFERGDIKAVLDLMADDVDWTETGATPSVGHYRGKEAVRTRWLAAVGESFDEFKVTPAEFIDAGDHIVVRSIAHVRLKGVDEPVAAPVAHIWRFEGGKIASGHFIFADEARLRLAMQEAGVDM